MMSAFVKAVLAVFALSLFASVHASQSKILTQTHKIEKRVQTSTALTYADLPQKSKYHNVQEMLKNRGYSVKKIKLAKGKTQEILLIDATRDQKNYTIKMVYPTLKIVSEKRQF